MEDENHRHDRRKHKLAGRTTNRSTKFQDVNQSDHRNSFIHSAFSLISFVSSSFSFDASGFLRIKLISIRRRRKNQQQQPQWWQLRSWLQQLLASSSDHRPIRQCGFLALVVLVLVLLLWLVPGRNWEVELCWHKHSIV